jgi:hypothetical protein
MSGGSFGLVRPLDLGTELGIGPTAIVAPDALPGAVGLGRLGVETDGEFEAAFFHFNDVALRDTLLSVQTPCRI